MYLTSSIGTLDAGKRIFLVFAFPKPAVIYEGAVSTAETLTIINC